MGEMVRLVLAREERVVFPESQPCGYDYGSCSLVDHRTPVRDREGQRGRSSRSMPRSSSDLYCVSGTMEGRRNRSAQVC